MRSWLKRTAFFASLCAAHPAFAGWLGRVCEGWLIADDPYQFEDASFTWLMHEVQRLKVKTRWGKINARESKELRALERELRRRENLDFAKVSDQQ